MFAFPGLFLFWYQLVLRKHCSDTSDGIFKSDRFIHIPLSGLAVVPEFLLDHRNDCFKLCLAQDGWEHFWFFALRHSFWMHGLKITMGDQQIGRPKEMSSAA